MEKQTYKKLFSSTFALSAFTFGGGFVIIPLMQKKFVDELGWIDKKEMLDLVAIAQSAPGVMAVNASIILGQKLAGPKGIAVATFGTILPPFLILSIISLFYESFKSNELISVMLEGMQAGIAAVVISAGLKLLFDITKDKEDRIYSLVLCLSAFIFAYFFEINVIYLIIVAIIMAVSRYFLNRGDKQ